MSHLATTIRPTARPAQVTKPGRVAPGARRSSQRSMRRPAISQEPMTISPAATRSTSARLGMSTGKNGTRATVAERQGLGKETGA